MTLAMILALLKPAGLTLPTNITSGMTSGNKILTLRTGDNWTGLNIPATSDAAGQPPYGNDGYWFTATDERPAVRGGVGAMVLMPVCSR